MATITASVAGGAWNTTTAWVGGVIPTAADDVLFGATSGAVNIPASYTALARSVNFTGYLAIFTFSSTTSQLSIGDASGGSLTLSSGMTLTLSGLGTINFVSTSSNGGTGWSITTAGKTLPNVTFNGAGGKWVQADALTSSGTITLTAGTWATGNFSVSAVSVVGSGSTARTMTPGSSSITCTGTSPWTFSTVTNLTMTANTATVTMSASGATLTTTTFNYQGMSFVMSGAGTVTVGSGTLTCANFTRTGPATKTGAISFNGNVTCTGTLALNGNSITNRLLVRSSVGGTSRTLTAATVSVSNADLSDMTGAGAGSWDLSAATGGSGDAQGNSGITFTPAQTNYWVGGTGSWSTLSHWANASGGSASSGRVPLPQDSVRVDGSSFTAGGQSLTLDMPRACADLDWTGVTNSPTWTWSVSWSFYGSLTMSSGIGTITTGGFTLTASGRSTYTVTSAGKSIPGGGTSFVVTAYGGTYTLADAASWVCGVVVNAGTFATAGFSLTVFSVVVNLTSDTKGLDFGTSSVSLSGTGNIFNIATLTGLTLSAASASIYYTNTTSSSRNFTGGGGQTYGSLNYLVTGATPGVLQLVDASTFGSINLAALRTLTLPAGSVTSTGLLTATSSAGNLTALNSSTSGTAATLRLTGVSQPVPGLDYLSIKDITAQDVGGGSGTNVWYAGSHSTNVSGNTGWNFSTLQSLAGGADGISTGSADLDVMASGASVDLAASSAGQATAGAALSNAPSLESSSAGVAATGADLLGTLPLAGTAAGLGASSGALARDTTLASTAAGLAAVDGSLGVSTSPSGAAAGSASLAGAVGATWSLQGDATAAAQASGTLTVIRALASSLGGAATGAGELTLKRGLAATVAGVSAVLGSSPDVLAAFTVRAAGAAGAAATVTHGVELTGASTGAGAVAVSVTYPVALTTAAAGLGAAQAVVTKTHHLSALSAGASTLVGSPTYSLGAAAVVHGTAGALAGLSLEAGVGATLELVWNVLQTVGASLTISWQTLPWIASPHAREMLLEPPVSMRETDIEGLSDQPLPMAAARRDSQPMAATARTMLAT